MEKHILKAALMAAFLICLYVSIPHLAWVFYSFENGDDTPITLLWVIQTSRAWWNAYLQAISIDGIIALVSLILTNRKSKTSKGIGYTFIGGLTLISWFFNWLYDKGHQPVYAGIWAKSIAFGFVDINRVTPIITSALPIFAIVFTIMIDTLTGDKQTPAELEQELREKRALAELRRQYQPEESTVAAGLKKAIGETAGLAKYAKTTLAGEKKPDTARTEDEHQGDKETHKKRTLLQRIRRQNADELESTTRTPDGQETDAARTDTVHLTDRNTDKLRTPDAQIDDNFTDENQTPDGQLTDKVRTPNEDDADNFTDNFSDNLPIQASSVKRPSKPLYISLSESSALSGYTSEYLSRLVSLGKVRTKSGDSKKLLRTSLEAYLKQHNRQLSEESTESSDEGTSQLSLVK